MSTTSAAHRQVNRRVNSHDLAQPSARIFDSLFGTQQSPLSSFRMPSRMLQQLPNPHPALLQDGLDLIFHSEQRSGRSHTGRAMKHVKAVRLLDVLWLLVQSLQCVLHTPNPSKYFSQWCRASLPSCSLHPCSSQSCRSCTGRETQKAVERCRRKLRDPAYTPQCTRAEKEHKGSHPSWWD